MSRISKPMKGEVSPIKANNNPFMKQILSVIAL